MPPALPERDGRVCWHPYTQHALDPEPLPVVGAAGAWLELAGGRRILDGISSWWTCLHGHGEPEIVAAISEQARRLDHVLFAGCTHEPAVRLAEELVAATPAGLSRVFYSDDGSTAVEVALKAAYQSFVRRSQASRTVFVALEGGYHGDTFGAMSAGDPSPFFSDFAPFLFRVLRVPPRIPALRAAISAHAGEVAAVILEPVVQGAAGMRPVDSGFVAAAARLVREAGGLLIADEVLTGFGRTGTLFACEQAGVAPDILCLAKGLTGGVLPLAATLVTEEVYAAFLQPDRARAFFHGHSFTANPIGCAAALASLELVRKRRTPSRFEALGRRIAAGLEGLRERPEVAAIRRFGGIVAVELESGERGYLSAAGSGLRAACRGRQALLRPLGNVLYAMPPACLSEEECDLLAAEMRAVCSAACDGAARMGA